MTESQQFKVEFIVKMKVGSGNLTRHFIADYIAERLAMSLMLEELHVNQITVSGYPFDLTLKRRRDRRKFHGV